MWKSVEKFQIVKVYTTTNASEKGLFFWFDRYGPVLYVITFWRRGIEARLSIIEKEIETFKKDIDDLKAKQSALEDKVNLISDNVGEMSDHGRDLQFVMDRQEQYSRKNSIKG